VPIIALYMKGSYTKEEVQGHISKLKKDLSESNRKLKESEVSIEEGKEDLSDSNKELKQSKKDLKEVRKLFEESENKLFMLTNMIKDFCVMVLDDEGFIIGWNEGAEFMLGYTSDEIIEKHISIFFTEEDVRLGLPEYEIDNVRKTGRAESNNWIVKKDGTKFWAEGFSSKIISKDKRFEGVAKMVRDQTRHDFEQQRMHNLAFRDHLTGLLNRAAFEPLFEDLLKDVGHEEKLALLFIDLDKFKFVNDTYGHKIGDLLLIEVGNRLMNSIRKSDFIAREGGDEFIALVRDVKDEEDIKLVAEKIVRNLTEKFNIDGNLVQIGCSIGIAISPDNSKDPKFLKNYADLAMYVAKKKGGNDIQFYQAKE
jgi:diguanylate cyclase (GGDEF)-like protein/PAS domain S-box-containing protein